MLSDNKYTSLVKEICPFYSNMSKFGSDYVKNEKKFVKNVFWSGVWDAYCNFTGKISNFNWDEFLMQPVWLNPLFKIAGRSFQYNNYVRRGALFVNDFINELGRTLSFNEFQRIFDVNTNFLQYESITRSIRNIIDNPGLSNKACKLQNPLIQTALKLKVTA